MRSLGRRLSHCIGSVAVAAAVVLLGAPTLLAHDAKALQSDLRSRERYFQPIARPAPPFDLVDASGRRVGLADLRGEVVVLHFVYTRCPDVCPLHAEHLAEVQKMVNATPTRERVRFVTITTDPARDTAEIMRRYGPAHGLDPVNWTFLTVPPGAAEDATRRLAEAYGHKFTRMEDGYQMHSVVTHVIDGAGVWRANFHGLEFQPVNLVLLINGLVNAEGHPHEEVAPSQGWWQRLKGVFGG